MIRLVPIAYLVQFALVLGAYFAVHNFDIPMFMRVMGSPRVVAGWPGFLTLGAYNRYSSMPATLEDTSLEMRCGDQPLEIALERPQAQPAVWTARFTVPPSCARIDGRVEGTMNADQTRAFDFTIPVVSRPVASQQWHHALWAWRPAVRSGQNASGSLSVRPRDEDCGHQLSVTTPSSFPSRFMPALMSFRIVADDGLPVADTELEVVAGTSGASPLRLRTDVLGIANAEMEFAEQTTLTVRYTCNGAVVERYVDVQPGWIQERVIPVPWIQRSAMPVSFAGEFTRSGDEWTDLIQCDGAMVAAREMRVAPHARQEWAVGTGTSSLDTPVHCVHHRVAFLTQNPQRTSMFMIRRPEGLADGPALAAMAAAQREFAPSSRRPFLGEQTVQLLSVADSAAASRFAAWWAGFPPPMYEPPSIVADDLETVRAELESVRGTGLARIRVILVVEVIVLMVWMLSVFIPARRAATRRLQAALAELDDDQRTGAGAAGISGGWVPLMISLVMLLLVMTGIGVLVGLMH
jgi:hypothetical protein